MAIEGRCSTASAPGAVADFPAHLDVIKFLGKGAYGSVYLCEDIRTGKQVAVKQIQKAAQRGKTILREMLLLARLRHENLLSLLDFAAVSHPDVDTVFLVLPYMASDLHKVITSKQTLTDRHVQVLTCQLLRGLAHLHASSVSHRDLKPANVLLTADCRLKICDFGLARGDMPIDTLEEGDGDDAAGVAGEPNLTEYVVTRWYRAPEVMLLPKQYTSAVDIWSAGCILCEILGRKPIFPGRNHIDMICRVAAVMGTPTEKDLTWLPKDSDAYRFLQKACPKSRGVLLQKLYPQASASCLDLAEQMLGWHPGQRPSASEAQQHPYLRSLLPEDPVVPPEVFDWSFDKFKATVPAVQERLYKECARYHPEILERDRSILALRRAAAASANNVSSRTRSNASGGSGNSNVALRSAANGAAHERSLTHASRSLSANASLLLLAQQQRCREQTHDHRSHSHGVCHALHASSVLGSRALSAKILSAK